MRPMRLLTARWLALGLATLALAGCGAVNVHPSAPSGSTQLASRGKVDNPATNLHNHLGCLLDAHLPVQALSPIKLQVGPAPAGPTIVFTPSPAVAQSDQIQGKAQAAEVIGSALVYPNQGSDDELARIGSCLAQGVQG